VGDDVRYKDPKIVTRNNFVTYDQVTQSGGKIVTKKCLKNS
jgi:hypothetical protein